MSFFNMFNSRIKDYSDILSDLVDLTSEDKPNSNKPNKYDKDSFVEVDYEVKSEQSNPSNLLIG